MKQFSKQPKSRNHMGLPKGQGGRKKGSKNRLTKDVREAIGQFLQGNFGRVQEIFDSLPPASQLKFLTDLLPYHTPKLNSTELTSDLDKLTDDQIKTLAAELLKKIK